MKARRRTLAVALAAAALAASGCGGDDGSQGAEPVDASESDVTRNVVVESNDGAFNSAAVYERASPGVVTIISQLPAGSAIGSGRGQGSGFVISRDGEIATNAHVVTDGEASGESEIAVARRVYVQFADRNQVEAEIVGFDPFADVALLRVEPDGLELEPLELGDLEQVGVGDPVAAIGSPFGEEQSLSVGVISATDRAIPSLTQFRILGAIQTDASINPGNSGGPLLDAEGRVIGINQQIDTTSGGNQGVGFAVPINVAQRSLAQLREDGEAAYAFLGVGTKPIYPQLAEELNLETKTGALVESIEEGSPAERAGLEAGDSRLEFQGVSYRIGGDVIVAIDGKDIQTENDLAQFIELREPGERIEIEVLRDGERETVTAELAERPT